MIILDFETNSHNQHDVIEVAAVKILYENGKFSVVDRFHRYYLSRYPLNYHAFAVHRLTPELILEHRAKSKEKYVSYFNEDLDFIEFCQEDSTLIAHNINFELRHTEGLAQFSNHICTMKSNRNIVKALNKKGNIKNPKLDETCLYYQIDFDPNSYHSATYDVSKTFEILKCMSENGYFKDMLLK